MSSNLPVLSLTHLFGEDADVLQETDFQILLLATLVEPLGFAALSPVLEALTGPFGVSEANVGLLMSAYTAPAILIIPVAGILADRYGRKPLLLVGIFLIGAGGVTVPLTTDFRVILGLRVVQGIGAAAIIPTIITLIGDLYEGTSEATAQGFRFTVTGITQMVIPILAGVLVVAAWQYPFFIYVLAFPILLVVSRYLTEPSSSGRPTGDGDDAVSPAAEPTLKGFLAARRVQAVLLMRALPGMLWIGFLSYNSIIVVRFMNGTPLQAGVLAAVASLSYAVAATQTGRITALFDSRFVPLVAANLFLGAGFLVVFLVRTFPFALVGIAVFGAGFGLHLSIVRSLLTGLPPATLRGRFVSLGETVGRFTITLAPVVMGVLITAATPSLGFELAVQVVGAAFAVTVAGGGIVALVAARSAAPFPDAP